MEPAEIELPCIVVGDAWRCSIQLFEDLNQTTPLPIDGCQFSLEIRKSRYCTSPLFIRLDSYDVGGIMVTDIENGIISLAVEPAATSQL
ncbi:MAG TPA: hypothetical protein V6C72_02255, partial [Chroococcales cyanobacterium]